MKNEDTSSAEKQGGNIISETISTFLRLSDELDHAVRGKDEKEKELAHQKLSVFYGTLSADQQIELQEFAKREVLGKVVEDQRGWIHRTLVRAMHVPHRIVGASAEPIAKFTGETIKLIVMILGIGIVGGLVVGVRKSCKEVMRNAA